MSGAVGWSGGAGRAVQELNQLSRIVPAATPTAGSGPVVAGGAPNTFGAWVQLATVAQLGGVVGQQFQVHSVEFLGGPNDVLVFEVGYGDGTLAGTAVISRRIGGFLSTKTNLTPCLFTTIDGVSRLYIRLMALIALETFADSWAEVFFF